MKVFISGKPTGFQSSNLINSLPLTRLHKATVRQRTYQNPEKT